MRQRLQTNTTATVIVTILLIITGFILPEALADEPMLAIRLTDENSAIYPVSEIEQLGFDGDETLVAVTTTGTDSYATESIQRIDFLFEFAAVDDPTEAATMIKAIHLFQNQPNPFSPNTQIRFELPRAGEAELQIFSPDGRLVRTLVIGERVVGPHTVSWDGLDAKGNRATGGVYFYNLRAPGIKESRRMILLH
jgi:FlgD Ig-like domain